MTGGTMAASRNFPSKREVEVRLETLRARLPERRSEERRSGERQEIETSERDPIETMVRLKSLEARFQAQAMGENR